MRGFLGRLFVLGLGRASVTFGLGARSSAQVVVLPEEPTSAFVLGRRYLRADAVDPRREVSARRWLWVTR